MNVNETAFGIVVPDFVGAYFLQGQYFLRRQSRDEAIDCFKKALACKSNSSDTYAYFKICYNMGTICMQIQEYALAIDCFKKCVELVQNNKKTFDDYEIIEENGNTTTWLKLLVRHIMMLYNQTGDFINSIEYYFEQTEKIFSISNARIDIFKEKEKLLQYLTNNLAEKNIATNDNKGDGQNILKNILLAEDKKEAYKEAGFQYENIQDLKNACECFYRSGITDMLELLLCFKKENRQNIVNEEILYPYLERDDFFNQIAPINNREKYKAAYVQALYIINLLYIETIEKNVVHYTSTKTANAFLQGSRIRLGTIVNCNDSSEGKVLMGYLFDKKNLDLSIDSSYQAFVACFTFNKDNLDMFRLYGKTNNIEGAGVSILLNNDFFYNSVRSSVADDEDFFTKDITELAQQHEPELFKKMDSRTIGILKPKRERLALCRCLYIDPQTNIISDFGRKEDFLIRRENNPEEIIKYHQLLNDITLEMEKLKGLVAGLDIQTIGKLLVNLRYLIKTIAFQTERECRLIKIVNVNNNSVLDSDTQKKYIEYAELNSYISEICLGPNIEAEDVKKLKEQQTSQADIVFKHSQHNYFQYRSKNIKEEKE